VGRPARHSRHHGCAVPDPERPGPHLSAPRPSPNIWNNPGTYELENRAFDPDGSVWSALRTLAPYDGRDVLDLGCGTGFHLPAFAESARSVIGVEPHASLAALARRRTRRLPNVEVRVGQAEALPLADASIDVVHARWAYFFGPGSEPGLVELDRVIRHGGTAVVVDNDATRSTFGRWFARGYPSVDAARVQRFWSSQGWTRTPVLTSLDFDDRADLEAVVRIEFTGRLAEEIIATHEGTSIDYAVNLWSKAY
jgi:SAM-dependent methyltransferase